MGFHTFVLALNERIRKISQGRVNTAILSCVLGISDPAKFNLYMSQVREYNLMSMPCMQTMQVKGEHAEFGSTLGKKSAHIT